MNSLQLEEWEKIKKYFVQLPQDDPDLFSCAYNVEAESKEIEDFIAQDASNEPHSSDVNSFFIVQVISYLIVHQKDMMLPKGDHETVLQYGGYIQGNSNAVHADGLLETIVSLPLVARERSIFIIEYVQQLVHGIQHKYISRTLQNQIVRYFARFFYNFNKEVITGCKAIQYEENFYKCCVFFSALICCYSVEKFQKCLECYESKFNEGHRNVLDALVHNILQETLFTVGEGAIPRAILLTSSNNTTNWTRHDRANVKIAIQDTQNMTWLRILQGHCCKLLQAYIRGYLCRKWVALDLLYQYQFQLSTSKLRKMYLAVVNRALHASISSLTELKRTMKRKLIDFDTQFYQLNNRKPNWEDKSPISSYYHIYNFIKLVLGYQETEKSKTPKKCCSQDQYDRLKVSLLLFERHFELCCREKLVKQDDYGHILHKYLAYLEFQQEHKNRASTI